MGYLATQENDSRLFSIPVGDGKVTTIARWGDSSLSLSLSLENAGAGIISTCASIMPRRGRNIPDFCRGLMPLLGMWPPFLSTPFLVTGKLIVSLPRHGEKLGRVRGDKTWRSPWCPFGMCWISNGEMWGSSSTEGNEEGIEGTVIFMVDFNDGWFSISWRLFLFCLLTVRGTNLKERI